MSNETEKLETNLRKELGDVKTAIISEIGAMRSNLVQKIDGVQTGIDGRFDTLLGRVAASKYSALIVGGAFIATLVVGIVIGAARA